MSFKIFDEDSGQWKRMSSVQAGGIKVLNTSGKFNSTNVEGCLDELMDNIKRIDQNVKYIYDNGTIGGGGGGGGSSVPTVKLDGELDEQGVLNLIVKSDEVIDIIYYFNSPNPGQGTAYLGYGAEVTTEVIKQGRNKWTVGPFKRGIHNLSIVVEDRQSFMTEPARIKVISGSLELTSDFSDAKDFNVVEDIIIPYKVLTELPESITAKLTFDGQTTEKVINKGDNSWNLGPLNTLGVHTASIEAYTETSQSNKLEYTLVAADTESLFVSTKFNEATYPKGKRLQVDYRISMRGQYQFKTKLYLNGDLQQEVVNPSGVSYWDLGTDLPVGEYTLHIQCMTMDEVHKDSITLNVEIVESGMIEVPEPTEGLIAKFEANGKMNSSTNKAIWEDKSGFGVKCNLHNFNYSTNGWVNDEELNQKVLKFSGKSYAVVDLEPMKSGLPTGMTVDVVFKVENTGNMDAKVVSCRAPETPYTGFMIDTEKAILSAKQSVKAQFQENTWTRITFVVDRLGTTIRTYTNAVISNTSMIAPRNPNEEDEFTYPGKIILGAGIDEEGNIIDTASCSIKSLRVYNKPLAHEDILNLHMSDIKTADELDKIWQLNYGEIAIPTMTITGVGIEDMVPSQDPITVKVDYSDPSNPSKRLTKDLCQLQIQGTSSKDYPVKNYTLWLRENDGQPLRSYTPVDGWMPEDRWTLKTNYMDSSHSNNIGLNKLIHEIFKEHPYPQQQLNPLTRSNVDGQPIRMIINGKDAGIYTWNIDRYAHNVYGLVTYNEDGTVNRHNSAVSYEIAVNSTTGAGAFNDSSWNSIKREFKHRYNYRGDDVTMKEGGDTVLMDGQHSELVELVEWVNSCTFDEFYADVSKHFSLPHLIDYYLIAHTFGMIDNLGKNMVLTTFGRNEEGHMIWYPSFYDCDSVLGLANNGEIRYDAGVDLEGDAFNTKNSSLWVKLRNKFSQQINDRYMELRRPRNVNGEVHPPLFSAETVMKYLDGEVMSKIGQVYYNQDAERKYINDPQGQAWMIMCNGQRKEFTTRWLTERFIYLDSLYEGSDYLLKSMILRTHVLGPITIRLKTYSPMWVRINYTSSSSSKVYVNKDRFYEFSVDMTNDTENDFTLYGADNLMFVDGIENLDVSHVNVSNATKLIELNVSESRHLKGLSLGNNYYLQKVVCNDCPRLGEAEIDKTIDLSNCVNLKHFNCSSRREDLPTKIQTVVLPANGGILEELNLSNTKITSLTMEGQEYLTELKLDNCKDLDSLIVRRCNGLTNISMPNTRLSTCTIEGCDNVRDIDLSNTKYLRVLNLNGCGELRKLNLSGVLSQTMTDLDLTGSLKLEELDISSTPYIHSVTFGRYRDEEGNLCNYNALKILKCSNSGLKCIRYSKSEEIPEYLDLKGLNLSYLNFTGCTSLQHIKNLQMTTSGSPFSDCHSLHTIEGSINFTNNVNRAFYGCRSLRNLHNTVELEMSEVTSCSEIFRECTLIGWSEIKYLFSKLGTKCTNMWGAFIGTSPSGSIPSNLFNNTINLENVSYLFSGCSKITGELPQSLLSPLTKLVHCDRMFSSTSITGRVPNDFLKSPGSTLKNTAYMFSSTKLTLAPTAGLFRWNDNLEACDGMFAWCKNMAGTIPSAIFHNKSKLRTLSEFYRGCTNVYGEVPRDLLRTVTKPEVSQVTNINYLFSESGISGSIPTYNSEDDRGLLDELPNLQSAEFLFHKTKIDTEIPPALFAYNPRLLRVSGFFQECPYVVGQIPEELFAQNSNLIAANNFLHSCVGLDSTIPQKLFHNNPYLSDLQAFFYGCTGLRGQIPDTIYEYTEEENPEDPEFPIITETLVEYGLLEKCLALTNVSNMFEGCSAIRSRVPENLLVSGQTLQKTDRMFYGCSSLYGRIPDKLFFNCKELLSTDAMFAHSGVGKLDLEVTSEDPYAIPEVLFSKCPNLMSVNSMFAGYTYTLPGEIPRDLFKYNANLVSCSGMFSGKTKITGYLDGRLFNFNPQLRFCDSMFYDNRLTGVGSSLLNNNPKLENISSMFYNNVTLVGPAPKLWNTSAKQTGQCFRNCNFDDQDTIPATFK